MSANLLRKSTNYLSPNLVRMLGNLWPPFLAAGIHIDRVSPDFREIDVSLTLRWYNKNYVGTHFGGSIYAKTDPFYMMILIQNLGRDYIVWDKAARIEFKKPGLGRIRAHFEFSEEEIRDVKAKADSQPKYVFDRMVNVTNEAGETVASINKTLYVRRKPAALN
jgi:hypothetical protein